MIKIHKSGELSLTCPPPSQSFNLIFTCHRKRTLPVASQPPRRSIVTSSCGTSFVYFASTRKHPTHPQPSDLHIVPLLNEYLLRTHCIPTLAKMTTEVSSLPALPYRLCFLPLHGRHPYQPRFYRHACKTIVLGGSLADSVSHF